MLNWIAAHTWIIPLAVTVLLWCIVVFGLITAKTGEDAIGMGMVFVFAVIGTLAAWALWLIGIGIAQLF